MRAASNNNQKSLPFAEVKVHSSKLSEEDTGYDSFANLSDPKARINSAAGLSFSSSSSSSSNNQVDQVVDFVKSLPSPTDLSTTPETSDIALSVAQRIVQFSKHTPPPLPPSAIPTRKIVRTRVQPLPDSTSDSADSFARSISKPLVHTATISLINLPPFSSNLEYVRDDRFDSTTTVDHVKNDVIAIEFIEHHPQKSPSQLLLDTRIQEQQHQSQPLPLIERFGESLRLLPANVLAVIVLGLATGLVVSALLVLAIA